MHVKQLRGWRSSDLATIRRAWWCHQLIMEAPSHPWMRVTAEELDAVLQAPFDGRLAMLEDGSGGVVFSPIDWGAAQSRLQVFLAGPAAPEAAAEALAAAARFAFDELNLARLYGYLDAGQEAAHRAAEQAGFAREATLSTAAGEPRRFLFGRIRTEGERHE